MSDEEFFATLDDIEADIDQMIDIMENREGKDVDLILDQLECIMAEVEKKSENLGISTKKQAKTEEDSLQKILSTGKKDKIK